MSRIGKMPVLIPKGVEIRIDKNRNITVKGPNGPAEGLLVRPSLPTCLNLNIEPDKATLEDAMNEKHEPKETSKLHGLFRSLLFNAVEGVTKGYEKFLELQGVGYKAEMKGANQIDLKIGLSHPTVLDVPKGIKAIVDKSQVLITIQGYDKQQVGKFAAEVRGVKPPEPYKGKGIRYKGEKVRRKEGKAAKAKA